MRYCPSGNPFRCTSGTLNLTTRMSSSSGAVQHGAESIATLQIPVPGITSGPSAPMRNWETVCSSTKIVNPLQGFPVGPPKPLLHRILPKSIGGSLKTASSERISEIGMTRYSFDGYNLRAPYSPLALSTPARFTGLGALTEIRDQVDERRHRICRSYAAAVSNFILTLNLRQSINRRC